MYLPLVVLSVSTIAETVSRGFTNLDYSPVLYEMESHPVFLSPQRPPRLHAKQRIDPRFFSHNPSMNQRHEMKVMGDLEKPHLNQQATIQQQKQQRKGPTHTFSHYYKNFKENNSQQNNRKSERLNRTHFVNLSHPTAANQKSNPSSRAHHSEPNANPLYHRRYQKTNSNSKSNPSDRLPISDIVSETHSAEILTEYHYDRGTNPIVVLPKQRLSHEWKAIVLVEPPIIVTTNRPKSAPRDFQTSSPQVKNLKGTRYRIPKEEYFFSAETVNQPNDSLSNVHLDQNGAIDLSHLNAQGTNRLEQTDRNLFYKNDPFLDITEVYSLPKKKVMVTTPSHHGTNLYYRNDSSAGVTDSGNTTNRTTRKHPHSSSADQKLVERKRQLKAFRNMKKALDAIPGKAGSDFPTHYKVPSTNFNCRTVKSPGFYADIEAGCQVFHNCDAEQQRHSFLCPNGTVFRQELLICDWWYNVRCEDASDFFPL